MPENMFKGSFKCTFKGTFEVIHLKVLIMLKSCLCFTNYVFVKVLSFLLPKFVSLMSVILRYLKYFNKSCFCVANNVFVKVVSFSLPEFLSVPVHASYN